MESPSRAQRFRPRPSVAALIAVVGAFVWGVPAASQRAAAPPRQIEIVDGREVAAGEALVKFHGPLPAQVLGSVDAVVRHPLPTGAYRIHSTNRSAASLVAALRGRRDVAYAEPNYVVRGTAIPDDPLLSAQWFLNNPLLQYADISAPEAWSITTGSPGIVVGVVDSGIDKAHPDLAANVWRAPASYTIDYRGGTLECPAGSQGVDMITGTCSAFDAHGHGTAMAGAIGAVGNNGIGTSGVNWRTSLMDLRFLGADNRGFMSDAINAIDVAMQLKSRFGSAANVRILSNSWMADWSSQALYDAVQRTVAADMLFVAAAGNDGVNADVSPRYPAAYPLPNVIAVAATTSSDDLPSYSNYGAATVHLGAPGSEIHSTAPGGRYLTYWGTSPATAVVSGVAALVLSACPLDTAALRQVLLQTVDPVPALAGKTVTGGRVNAYAALQHCAGGNQAPVVNLTSPVTQSRFVAPATISIAANASDPDGRVTKVDFYADGVRLGSAFAAPYTLSWTNVAAGVYTLYAIATDQQGRTASSGNVRIFVDPPPTPMPSPWASSDVGATGLSGSASYGNGVFTARGAGADVWGTADAFHYVYQPLAGDGTIVARVASVEYVAAWTKAGVMIRSSLNPGASHAFMIVSAGKGYAFQRRTADGGTSTHTSGGFGMAPQWVRLSRAGPVLTAAISADGVSWTTVGQDTVAMPTTVYVGLAITSHTATQIAQAAFDSVLVTAAASPPLPAPWDHADVGLVGADGRATESGGRFTIAGAGADIWGTADAFHYVYRPLRGDVTIVARVTSVEYIHAWTKAGVMIRQTLDPSSPQAMMLVSPGKGLAFQRRTAAGAISTHTSGGAGGAPRWVKLARSGATIAASISMDGLAWTEIGRDTFAIGSDVYVGLAVSSHVAGTTAAATFDGVAVSQPAALPPGWTAADVGSVGIAGAARESAGTFTVTGAGADVWGTVDALHYVYVPMTGDGSITARVGSVEYVAAWTKVGVMIRESLDPGSPQAFMLVSAGKGVAFQRRVSATGISTSTRGELLTAPQWVKLVRSGATIAAWTSTDGLTWTSLGADTFAMGSAVLVGLAVSSHDATRAATATFSNVSRTP